MKRALVILMAFVSACSTVAKKERQPSSTAMNPDSIERIPLLLSENRSEAITRSVVDGKQLRFQICWFDLSQAATNKDVLDAVNRRNVGCSDINHTGFEAQNEAVSDMLDKAYAETLTDILVRESKQTKLYTKVARYALISGMSASLAGVALISAPETRAAMVGGKAMGYLGAASIGIGIVSLAVALSSAGVTARDFMRSQPTTLESSITKMIKEQKLMTSDQIGADFLFNEIVKAIDKSTQSVFTHFYST